MWQGQAQSRRRSMHALRPLRGGSALPVAQCAVERCASRAACCTLQDASCVLYCYASFPAMCKAARPLNGRRRRADRLFLGHSVGSAWRSRRAHGREPSQREQDRIAPSPNVRLPWHGAGAANAARAAAAPRAATMPCGFRTAVPTAMAWSRMRLGSAQSSHDVARGEGTWMRAALRRSRTRRISGSHVTAMMLST